jgi:hypothetical protein
MKPPSSYSIFRYTIITATVGCIIHLSNRETSLRASFDPIIPSSSGPPIDSFYGFLFFVGLVACSLSFIYILDHAVRIRLPKSTSSWEPFAFRFLQAFRFFLRGKAREDIEDSIGDCRRDIRQMKDEKRSRAFIFYAITWQAIMTMVGISFGIVIRFIANVYHVFSPFLILRIK